jgi:hypothetical protein
LHQRTMVFWPLGRMSSLAKSRLSDILMLGGRNLQGNFGCVIIEGSWPL